jgi:hypothetical protein
MRKYVHGNGKLEHTVTQKLVEVDLVLKYFFPSDRPEINHQLFPHQQISFKKTRNSKMKLTFIITLFALAALGIALPVIPSQPTAPALLTEDKSLTANPPPRLAPRALVKRSTNIGLIIGVLVAGLVCLVLVAGIFICNPFSFGGGED